jgi:hypothetical protein
LFTIIPDQGAPLDLETNTPTYERLVDVLNDLPVHIGLPDTTEAPGGPIVAWVGDDYVAAEGRGEVARNIKATILMWALGAPRQPYAGNVAFTGIRENAFEGRLPVSLTNEAQILLTTLIFDIDRVLAGDPNPETPDDLRIQFQSDAVIATEMQYESMSMWTFDD